MQITLRQSAHLILLTVVCLLYSQDAPAPPPSATPPPINIACDVTTDYQVANLNEIKSKGGATNPSVEFVEVKILADNTDISGWEICFSDNPTKESCSAMGVGDGTWYFGGANGSDDNSPDGNTEYDSGAYLVYDAKNVKADAGEILLRSSVGAETGTVVLDYIRYDNTPGICGDGNERWNITDDNGGSILDSTVLGSEPDDYTACSACFDARDPDQKDFARSDPDGTGDWGNNGDTPTEGETNDDPTDVQPDHYAIDYSAIPGVTCEALLVTITPHDNLDTAVAATTTITIASSDVTTTWALNTGNNGLTDNANGTATYTFDGTETFIEVWMTQTTEVLSPGITITISDGTVTDAVDNGIEDGPFIVFRDAVFRFFADGVVSDINTQIAAKENTITPGEQTITLLSVQTDEATGACESRIENNQQIEFAYKCVLPATCSGSTRVEINDTTDITPGNNNVDTVDDTLGNFDNINNVDFGLNGEATITFDYNDAGRIRLYARKSVNASGDDPAYIFFGESNEFVVRPFGLAVHTIEDLVPNPNPAATDATGNEFIKAGEDFSVVISAYNWQAVDDDGSTCNLTYDAGCLANDGVPDTNADLSDNDIGGSSSPLTPNFDNTGASDVTLTAVAPFSPDAGTLGNIEDSVTLLAPSIPAASFSGGSASINTIYYEEVGTMTLRASATDYLSTGENLNGRSSNNASNSNNGSIGRFTPDKFLITDNTPTLLNTCDSGGFTYMDEIFSYDTAPALTITAVNTYDEPTVNYGTDNTAANNYWRLPEMLDRVYSDNGVNNGSNFMDASLATLILTGEDDFTDGIGVLTLSNVVGDRDTFTFSRDTIDLTAGEGAPFDASIDVVFQVTAGSLTDTDGICYDGDNDGTCEIDGSDDYVALTDTDGTELTLSELRFGRFVINNAVGSELLDLSPQFQTEYYDGNNFIVNTDDNCTFEETDDVAPLDLRDHLRLSNLDTSGGALQDGDTTMTIGAGTTSITTFNEPINVGDVGAVFSAPGEGNAGFVIIDGNLACNEPTIACVGTVNYDHLLYDWDDDGAFDNEPSGRIDFGIYQGNKNLIYIRESF